MMSCEVPAPFTATRVESHETAMRRQTGRLTHVGKCAFVGGSDTRGISGGWPPG